MKAVFYPLLTLLCAALVSACKEEVYNEVWTLFGPKYTVKGWAALDAGVTLPDDYLPNPNYCKRTNVSSFLGTGVCQVPKPGEKLYIYYRITEVTCIPDYVMPPVRITQGASDPTASRAPLVQPVDVEYKGIAIFYDSPTDAWIPTNGNTCEDFCKGVTLPSNYRHLSLEHPYHAEAPVLAQKQLSLAVKNLRAPTIGWGCTTCLEWYAGQLGRPVSLVDKQALPNPDRMHCETARLVWDCNIDFRNIDVGCSALPSTCGTEMGIWNEKPRALAKPVFYTYTVLGNRAAGWPCAFDCMRPELSHSPEVCSCAKGEACLNGACVKAKTYLLGSYEPGAPQEPVVAATPAPPTPNFEVIAYWNVRWNTTFELQWGAVNYTYYMYSHDNGTCTASGSPRWGPRWYFAYKAQYAILPVVDAPDRNTYELMVQFCTSYEKRSYNNCYNSIQQNSASELWNKTVWKGKDPAPTVLIDVKGTNKYLPYFICA